MVAPNTTYIFDMTITVTYVADMTAITMTYVVHMTTITVTYVVHII